MISLVSDFCRFPANLSLLIRQHNVTGNVSQLNHLQCSRNNTWRKVGLLHRHTSTLVPCYVHHSVSIGLFIQRLLHCNVIVGFGLKQLLCTMITPPEPYSTFVSVLMFSPRRGSWELRRCGIREWEARKLVWTVEVWKPSSLPSVGLP